MDFAQIKISPPAGDPPSTEKAHHASGVLLNRVAKKDAQSNRMATVLSFHTFSLFTLTYYFQKILYNVVKSEE